MCLYTAAAWFEQKITLFQVCKMLMVTWWSNFAGCACVACILRAGLMMDGKDAYLLAAVHTKITLPFSVIFCRG